MRKAKYQKQVLNVESQLYVVMLNFINCLYALRFVHANYCCTVVLFVICASFYLLFVLA